MGNRINALAAGYMIAVAMAVAFGVPFLAWVGLAFLGISLIIIGGKEL